MSLSVKINKLINTLLNSDRDGLIDSLLALFSNAEVQIKSGEKIKTEEK